MSQLAVASRIRRNVLALTAVTLIGFASSQIHAATAVGPTLLPSGSVAYLHVQVAELNQTPFARFTADLAGRVKNELANLTVHNFGVDITQLSEVTIVVPPLNVLAENNSAAPPVVIAATFATKFNPADISANLPEGWESSNIGDATVYTDGAGNSIYAASPRTLLFGAQTTLAWWIEGQAQQPDSRLPELLRESLGTGQVYFGADFSTLREYALQTLPPQVAPVFNAELASVTLNLSDQITLNIDLGYNSDQSAQQATQELVSLQKQGLAIIQYQEAEFQRQLTEANHQIDSAMEAIGALAVTRQAAAYLETLKLKQQDAWISTSLQVDPSLFVVASITAIGAANQDSNEAFGQIADQLEDEQEEAPTEDDVEDETYDETSNDE